MLSGLVDLERLRARGVARLIDHLGVDPEEPGRAPLDRTGLELHVEVLDQHVERLEVAVGELGPRGEVVVLGQIVGEALPDQHHRGAAEPPQRSGGRAEQDEDQADVEDQVAGLAQVAAFGGQADAARTHHAVGSRFGFVPVDPVVLLAEQRLGAVEHVVTGRRGGVDREPGEVARRTRWAGPHRAGVDRDPRDDAADERDEQQQVDRREPRRGVDREHPDRVVDRAERRVLVDEVVDPDRRQAALRDQRAGDGRQGQREQQHQRGPHRGQLGPEIPDPAAEAELRQLRGRGTHQITVSKLAAHCRSAPVRVSQVPVTRSRPTPTSRTPPIRMISP